MTTKHYDIIIIGSGGGSKLTRPCANLGLKVAIIEKDQLGGTCLNHGCIPSKMLIHSAEVATTIQSAEKFNIHLKNDINVTFKDLVNRVNNTIQAESESIKPLYEDHPNIDYYSGTAAFQSNHSIIINNTTITGTKIAICAGIRAKIPLIPGLKDTPYITYKEALKLTKQPKTLTLIGGGYISTELGYYFSALGTKTTLINRSPLLRQLDDDISNEFYKEFSKKMGVFIDTKILSIDYKNKQFHTQIQTKEKVSKIIVSDQLFVATGMKPNTDILNLKNTNIKTTKEGYIIVDEFLQTTASNIWAFGDIIGRYQFRHTANFEGEYLFKNLFTKEKLAPINYPPVPYAVFTHPQIAGVGLKEKDCIKEDIIIGKNEYKDSAMGMALQSDHGFTKLIFNKKSKTLIGAHIIGEQAATMIHMLIAYIIMGAKLDDLCKTIYIHPALPEIIRNAARKAKEKV